MEQPLVLDNKFSIFCPAPRFEGNLVQDFFTLLLNPGRHQRMQFLRNDKCRESNKKGEVTPCDSFRETRPCL